MVVLPWIELRNIDFIFGNQEDRQGERFGAPQRTSRYAKR